MKSLIERLKEEMDKSERFTRENYGLMVGDGFPEMCREVTKWPPFAVRIFKAFAIQTVSGINLLDRTKAGDMTGLAQSPELNELPMSMLYWGVQIGRQMQREEAEALRKMEGANADHRNG